MKVRENSHQRPLVLERVLFAPSRLDGVTLIPFYGNAEHTSRPEPGHQWGKLDGRGIYFHRPAWFDLTLGPYDPANAVSPHLSPNS